MCWGRRWGVSGVFIISIKLEFGSWDMGIRFVLRFLRWGGERIGG